jgi:hypothetical protein
MIPFTIPEDHHVINIAAISRIEELENDYLKVYFMDGSTVIYEEKPAKIVRAEVMFFFKTYQNFKQDLNRKIITANGKQVL